MLEMLGASFADKFGGGLGSSLGKSLGSALGGETGPMISSAASLAYGNTMDGSGWAVNMGAGAQNATSSAPKTQTIDPTSGTAWPSGLGGVSTAGMGGLPLLILGGAVVAAMLKRKG